MNATRKSGDAGNSVDIVVVTGMSGSGKSTAIDALEDDGYYCLDNLPTQLVPQFVDLCATSGDGRLKVALGLDLRDLAYTQQWPGVHEQLIEAGHGVRVLFLEASDEVLIRRYSETRRAHPLGAGRDLTEAIAEERERLSALRGTAGLVIDTGTTSVHDLKHAVHDAVSAQGTADRLSVTIRSFGFKYGGVRNADMVFDVRFLPNPYFVEELRSGTGKDAPVAEYVLERDDTKTFLKQIQLLLDFLLPRFAHEGRSYLTIAVGCTGGRHRSVAIAESLGRYLRENDQAVMVRHRDIDVLAR